MTSGKSENILDVGCGPSKMRGAVGLDLYPWDGVDIVADLDRFPWPVEDNQFSEIHFNSCMEHLSDIRRVMMEVHRIGKPGAKVFVESPHFSSADTYTDVTHRHGFSLFSFDAFLEGQEGSFMREGSFRMLSRRVEFWVLSDRIRIKPYWLIERLANRAPHLYERFLAFVFPARSIHLVLEVVKSSGGQS
jgi:SAM-dependent methyltransferase